MTPPLPCASHPRFLSSPPQAQKTPAPGQQASLLIHTRPGRAVEEGGAGWSWGHVEPGLIPELYWFKQPVQVMFLAA